MDERRYREAEQRLFDEAGISPQEHLIHLERVGADARVLEVGAGTPVLFLTGGPAAAAQWAHVVARAQGVRCLLLDRPGTGLSAPLTQLPDATSLPTYVEQLTADVLDAFDLDHAALVGSSLGGYSALRSAAAYPDRIIRLVLLGCPAFVPGWSPVRFFTLLRAPLVGRLMLAAPATRASTKFSLKEMGHRRSIAEGRITPAVFDWTFAWQRYTDTMRNDAAMIKKCGTWRGGFAKSLDLTAEDLARVHAPCAIAVGTDDPVGGEDVARQLGSLLPNASVAMWDGAGHLPWFDEPDRAAHLVSDYDGRSDAGRRQSGPRHSAR